MRGRITNYTRSREVNAVEARIKKKIDKRLLFELIYQKLVDSFGFHLLFSAEVGQLPFADRWRRRWEAGGGREPLERGDWKSFPTWKQAMPVCLSRWFDERLSSLFFLTETMTWGKNAKQKQNQELAKLWSKNDNVLETLSVSVCV